MVEENSKIQVCCDTVFEHKCRKKRKKLCLMQKKENLM